MSILAIEALKKLDTRLELWLGTWWKRLIAFSVVWWVSVLAKNAYFDYVVESEYSTPTVVICLAFLFAIAGFSLCQFIINKFVQSEPLVCVGLLIATVALASLTWFWVWAGWVLHSAITGDYI